MSTNCPNWGGAAAPPPVPYAYFTLYKNNGERNDFNNYRQRHLPTQHCRQRICSSRTDTPPEAGGACLPRVTVWLTTWKVDRRQLQEKCREQQMPLYIACIDITKAFDLDSGSPKLQSMIESFHTDTKGTVQFNGSS